MKFLSLAGLLWVVTALGVGWVGSAQAGSIRQQQSFAAWRKEDDCAHEAFLKFPDYTVASNARRDAATRVCEKQHHVLLRAPRLTPLVKRILDAAAE
ncbi:MAG TPA: hypothetical protein VIJ42_15305 [Stellaceae bacterium]